MEISSEKIMSMRPVVSIGMLTYNHEKYIAKAIESVLMQEVNFTYELVIGEDCSTDNTRKIVMAYQKKYPDIIRLFLHDKNVGMQENGNCLRRVCRGKYRANLEGDDFWISTDKLQRQVDFLEANPDYIATGGDFICVNDSGIPCNFPWGALENTYCRDEEYTKEHLQRWLLPSHISATLFRNVFYEIDQAELESFESVQILGDRRVYLYLVMQGRIHHENKPVMVRRILTKSTTSFTNAVKKSNWQKTNYDWLCVAEKYALERFGYKLDFSKRKEMHWLGSIKMFFWSPNRVNFNIMCSIFKASDKKVRYLMVAVAGVTKKIAAAIKRDGFFRGMGKGIRKVCKKIRIFRADKSEDNSKYSTIMNSFSKQ